MPQTGWYRWQGTNLILKLRVQPKASKDEFCGPHGEETFRVRITAPPVDGQANKHLCRFTAKAFGVSASQVTLLNGQNSRNKTLQIENPKKFPFELD